LGAWNLSRGLRVGRQQESAFTRRRLSSCCSNAQLAKRLPLFWFMSSFCAFPCVGMPSLGILSRYAMCFFAHANIVENPHIMLT
jgi:hypothetical protein